MTRKQYEYEQSYYALWRNQISDAFYQRAYNNVSGYYKLQSVIDAIETYCMGWEL